jgi:hypothetical protein
MHAYVDMTFPQHLEVWKEFYDSECAYGMQTNGKPASMVPIVRLGWDLDAQQGFFKLYHRIKCFSSDGGSGGIGN